MGSTINRSSSSGIVGLYFIESFPLLLSVARSGCGCMWGLRPSAYAYELLYTFRHVEARVTATSLRVLRDAEAGSTKGSKVRVPHVSLAEVLAFVRDLPSTDRGLDA
jgi:hypothetical protein